MQVRIHAFDDKLHPQQIGDDPVVGARLKNVGARDAENPAECGGIAGHTEHRMRKVAGEYGVLEEVSSANEFERLSGPKAFDQLGIPSVQWETARQRAGAINV